MSKKIGSFFILFIFVVFFISCTKTEFLDKIVFDYSLLSGVSFNVEKKEIISSYTASLEDPFIDHVMQVAPSKRIISWAENNITTFGTMNRLIIDIARASISRKEISSEKKIAGVTKQQDEYIYEVNITIKFVLYDDNNHILATTEAETYRSTTSSKFISLSERNHILDELTLESLRDVSDKSTELIKSFMSEYIL